jgi:apolipoprotein N-acyltransferase
MSNTYKKIGKKIQRITMQHPFVVSFVAGCIYFAVVMSWMFTVRTSEIAKGNAAKYVGISAALIMVSSFATGFVLFTLIIRKLKIRIDSKSALILIPAAWVVSEYLRAVFFSIVSLGPTGRIGPYWSYGDVGYILGLTPLTYLGRLGGVYFLSFIAVFIIVLIIRTFRLRAYRFAIILLVAVSLLSALCWKLYSHANGRKISIAALSYRSVEYPLIQSNEARKLIERQGAQTPEVVVLPEYSGFYVKDSKNNDQLLQAFMKNHGLVIQSRREIQDSYNKNMLVFLAPNGQLLNEQQKWFTVPSGEYVPYVYQVLLAYAGQGQLLLDFRNQKSVLPGDRPETPYTFDGVSYGSLVCSGITSPEHYRALAANGAVVLTNSASLGSLGVSSFHHTQAQMMAQRYAIDTARPFIQSAKDAPAFIYDHNGKLLGKTTNGIIQTEVTANSKKTPYTLFGDWIVVMSSLIIVIVISRPLIFHKKKDNIKT